MRESCLSPLLVCALILSAMFRVTVQAGEGSSTTIPRVTARQLGYSIRHWNIEDGLPLDRVLALAQTKDGYLWVGMDSGNLCRFDGSSFVEIKPNDSPRAKEYIYGKLLGDSRGWLWVNPVGGPLERYFEGRFAEIPGFDLVIDNDLGPITGGPDGSVWFARRTGAAFYRWKDGKLSEMSGDARNPSRHPRDLVAARNKQVWGIWDNQTLFQLTDDGPVDYSLEASNETGDLRFGGLTKLRDGDLAVFSSNGMYRLEDDHWVMCRQWTSPINVPWYAVEDSRGTLWLAAPYSRELLSIRGDHIVRVHITDGNFPIHCTGILTDSFENVWIATLQGLFQLRPTLFRTLSTEEGLPGKRIASITSGMDGHIWLDPQVSGVFCRLTAVSESQQLETFPVDSDARWVIPESADSRWLVSERASVWFWHGDNVVLISTNLAAGGDPPYVQDVLKTKRGELWIGTNRGLYRRDGDAFVLLIFPDGSVTKGVSDLAEDQFGRIYAASYFAGVFVFDNQTSVKLSGGDPVRRIVRIDVAEDGTVWAILGKNGLARWREGQWRILDPQLTAELRNVISVAVDHFGGLWLGTESQGIIRFSRRDLEEHLAGRLAKVDSNGFGPDDGLGSLACDGYNSGILNGPDDRLWIATADGISVVDPRDIPRQKKKSRLPAVAIEKALVDDVPVSLGADAVAPPSLRTSRPSIQVPAGKRRVEVRFAALDLASGEHCRFQYRLKNYNDEWEDAGTRRSVVFHRVPPGRYVFEVRVANAYGVWNESPSSMAMTFVPFWWQRTAIQALGGILLLGAVFVVVRRKFQTVELRRLRQEAFSRQLLESQENERQRIARELHDGLGQNLSIVRNTLHLADEMVKAKSGKVAPLDDAAGMVDQAISELREISFNLRPHLLNRLGLGRALDALVQQVQSSTPCEVRLISDPIDGVLPPELEIHLYRIIQEVLNNVVKHAEAREVCIRLYLMAGRLYLDVQDDGRGFDAGKVALHASAQGGMGLTGMRERVRILGGTIDIKSQPESGTEVNIIIPLDLEA